MNLDQQRIKLSGIVVDLMEQEEALAQIIAHAALAHPAALSVVSANLDHIVQFGLGSRWFGVIGDSLSPTLPLRNLDAGENHRSMNWLTLLDGAPLVTRSRKLTGRKWPRLAGSDLIDPVLDRAQQQNLSVGFLGGAAKTQQRLARQLAVVRPQLRVSGFWAPEREQLQDHDFNLELAAQIKARGTDILVVGLGKPRQELWMSSYGALSGAKVLLAFGAVVDFLAGAVKRAPGWVADNGLEWAWRLMLEPRRLSRRYLLYNPPGLLRIRKDSSVLTLAAVPLPNFYRVPLARLAKEQPASFVGLHGHADISVLIVTYNNAHSIDPLIASLRRQAATLDVRVIVADNNSADDTVAKLRAHKDVTTSPTGANLGYAGGLNHLQPLIGDCEAVLVLNPDLTIGEHGLDKMLSRLRSSRAGIVVPRLLLGDGQTYVSLRREPTLARALGDALFGERLARRPEFSSEIEFDGESYEHPHLIQWATGAALMVEAGLHERLGPWDERFFLYSEETDYFRRARTLGASCWYEPEAQMIHDMGGSGSSLALNALMAVNRIRYVRKHHSPRYAHAYAALVTLHEFLRMNRPAHRGIVAIVANERRWKNLPAAQRTGGSTDHFPPGSVIIPAHNEAAVIARTLEPLAALAQAGSIKVIVACNGCTDDTASIAAAFPGVTVLETEIPSKTHALNMADKAAGQSFPRLYLDADISITPAALRATFEHLAAQRTPAARPAFTYDDAGAQWLVRSFYRARRRIPSAQQALWGAGAYAVNREGRARFGAFPDLTADDLFIDELFDASEKQVLPTIPVVVQTPRSADALMAILTRNYRGQRERNTAAAPKSEGTGTRQTVRELIRGIHGPASLVDAAVYASFVLRARTRAAARRSTVSPLWERDESSRLPGEPVAK